MGPGQIRQKFNVEVEGVAGGGMPTTWAIRVAAYRLLIEGQPATLEDIARTSGRDVAQVERCLQGSLELRTRRSSDGSELAANAAPHVDLEWD